MLSELPIHGRGASANPANRFELISYERDPDYVDPDDPTPTTQFYRDQSRSLITYNDSPDLPFDASMNPYRGCEHGCVYCYARPYHEYLGLSAGLDFETKIFVKEDAPEILRRELSSPRWRPQTVSVSGVTDCYQPIERRLHLTRRCLEVFAEFRNPVGIVTKNHLVTRDQDVLAELARHKAAVVYLSVTTLDAELARTMEPRASHPAGRLAAIRELAAAGIPVGVMVAPIIPGLNDHEIPGILQAAADAGASSAGYVMLRLPHGLGPMFEGWLDLHYPDRKEKVLGRIKELRGGQLNDPRFGTRMRGEGIFAQTVHDLFTLGRRKMSLDKRPELSAAAFRPPGGKQMMMFDELSS
jgi:DNA repair photolyase